MTLMRRKGPKTLGSNANQHRGRGPNFLKAKRPGFLRGSQTPVQGRLALDGCEVPCPLATVAATEAMPLVSPEIVKGTVKVNMLPKAADAADWYQV
jgi:hypothetical protein